MNIWTIGVNSFKRLMRSKILYVMAVFCLITIAYASLYGTLTAGQEGKLMKDVGLAGIAAFSILVAILVGSTVVAKEIESKTIQILLAKPVKKHEFLLGEFLAAALTILMMTAIMGVGFLIIVAIKGIATAALVNGVVLVFFEAILLASIAIFFSTFFSGMVASVFTFIIFVFGHLTYQLPFLVQRAGNVVVKFFGNLLYFALPNLQYFNIRGPVAHNLNVPGSMIFAVIVYGLLYSSIMILASALVFKSKDFA
ncbi:MAG: ABC transporter permease subunit [Candidatus Omnitrophica bacterium]|nr:ABC transporter permease subunit [Candidatus Omnitrophota bacterium]